MQEGIRKMKNRFVNETNKQRALIFIYVMVLMIGIAGSFNNPKGYIDVFAMPASGKVVVIDAGHGGSNKPNYL